MRGGVMATDAAIAGLTDGSYICGSTPGDAAELSKYARIITKAEADADKDAKAVYRANGNIYLVKKDKAPDGRSVYVTPTP